MKSVVTQYSIVTSLDVGRLYTTAGTIGCCYKVRINQMPRTYVFHSQLSMHRENLGMRIMINSIHEILKSEHGISNIVIVACEIYKILKCYTNN